MPPVIAFIASGITFIATMGAAGSGIAALVVATTAVVAASRLLKPKINFSVDDNDRSRQTTVRSTTEPRKLVYGETLVSGPLTYAQVSGANNKYMHQVVALAGHELTAIKKVYFDDKIIDLTNSGVYNPTTKLVTSGFFGPKNNEAGTSETIVYIDTRLGANSQTVYAGLRSDAKTATEYLATHLGNGVASLYTRWTINEGSREVWDEVGTVQNIKALVQGKKVYDPRLEVAANSGNPAFAGNSPTNAAYVKYDDDSLSTASIDRGEQGKNPALMIADYLMDSEFGLGISATKIDWSAIITAADACDTLVPIPNSATQKRFFGSGVIFGADPYAKSIEKILSGMNGSLAYSQGKYIVHAGIFVQPSENITEDDIIGKVDIRTAIPRSDRLNQIKGLFIDPTEQYKMMEFGPVTVSGAIARDNGEVLEEEIKLPFTDNRYAAQRIAFKQVNQSFLQTVITVPVNLKGMRIAIGDRVRVYLSDLESVDSGQWNPKIFKCINWSFAENGEGGINLTLIEDAEARYNDPAATDYSTITAAGVIARNLPDVPAPTNFGITAAINTIELSWDNPSDALAWEQIWVYRSTSATTPTDSDTPIVKFRGTSYTDQRAADGTEYYYWIQAIRYPQGSTPASGSNASKSVMVASSPAKIAATKIGVAVMGEDSIDTAQIIDSAVGSDQIAVTIQSDNFSVANETGWQINKDGDTTFNNTVVRGNISATTGTVGGFTIGSTDLIAGDGATRVSLSTDDGISLGNNTFASAPFRVTRAGALSATGATITGAITATSLTLSGITIPKTDLATGVQTSLGDADSALQDADTGVNLGLNDGSVGGITINSASLTSGSHTTYASTEQGFFLGSDGSMSFADGTNQTLTIDTSGNLSVIGAITATSGTFAGSVSVNSSGKMYGGTMSSFNSGSGFFLGYDTDAYKLSVGDASGEVLTWDGSKLNVEANTVSFSTGGEQDYSSESRYTTSQKSATVVLANNSSYFLFDNRRQDLAFPDFIVSYYLGPLTSGIQSSAANALNGIMENIKAELFYADASTGSPGTWTSLVSVDATSWDVASGPVFPGYVYSNFRVRESGTYVASLDTRNDILDDYPTISPFGDALDGTSVPVGLVDNDYFINIPLSKNTFVFPKGRYFIKVVITVTDGSLSPYPATGSPTATERRISIPNASSFVHPDFGQSVFVGGAHTTIFTDNNRDNETLIKGGSVYLMSKEGANAADQDSTAIFFGGRGTTGGTPNSAYGPLHGLYFFNDRDAIGSGSGILGSIGSPQFSMYVPYDGSKLTFGGDANFTDGLYINGVAVNAGAVTGPAGADTQIQYNDGGSLGASANLTFNDSTNTLTVSNLTVSGTTTTVNTDNLTVKDPNITLNYSTGDSSSTANNAGITIQDAVSDGVDSSILWRTANDSFDFSHTIRIKPPVSPWLSQSLIQEILFDSYTSSSTTRNLKLVNHNGNWLDGNSGADTAWGWMWSASNQIRAGVHYDTRSVEKFDFYSSYGEIRFRIPDATSGNISPIDSETTMPARLTIKIGGDVAVNTGSLLMGSTAVIDADRNITAAHTTTNKLTVNDDGSASPLVNIVADDNSPWLIRFGNDDFAAGTSGALQGYLNNSGDFYWRLERSVAGNAYGNYQFQVYNGTTTVTALTLRNDLANFSGQVAATVFNATSVTPIRFTNRGTGTYQFTEIYHGQNDTSNNESNGLFIEMARLSDSATAEVRHFVVGARGGQKQLVVDGTGNTDIYGDLYLHKGAAAGNIYYGTSGSGDYLKLQDVATGTAALSFVQDSATKFAIDGTTGNLFATGGIYGQMTGAYNTENAMAGGGFSDVIDNYSTALKLTTRTINDSGGSARVVGDYSSGIQFQHLDYTTYGNSYQGGQAWIGLRVHDTAGQERDFLVFATNNATTSGTFPTERMTISPEGYVGFGQPDPSYAVDVSGAIRTSASGNVFNSTNGTATAVTINSGSTDADNSVLQLTRGTGSHKGPGLHITSFNYTNGNDTDAAFLKLNAGAYGGSDTNYLKAYDNTSTKFLMRGDGRLGILTDSPAVELDVRGNVAIGDAANTEQDILYTASTGQWQVGTNNEGIDSSANNQFFFYDTSYRLSIGKGSNSVAIGSSRHPTWSSPFGGALHIATSSSSYGGALSSTGGNNFRAFTNTYYDSGYKRNEPGRATMYELDQGRHLFYSAANSGSADSAISWTGVLYVGDVGLDGTNLVRINNDIPLQFKNANWYIKHNSGDLDLGSSDDINLMSKYIRYYGDNNVEYARVSDTTVWFNTQVAVNRTTNVTGASKNSTLAVNGGIHSSDFVLAPSGTQNILNKTTKEFFTFTGSAFAGVSGTPKNVADETDRRTTSSWPSYGYQTADDASGVAWLKVDCKTTYNVTHVAVSGYPGGSHKPSGDWYLQGSNDDSSWTTLAIGDKDQWTAGTQGSYGFKPHQIVGVTENPAGTAYRYFRIYATGWTNGYLLMMNWGLFVGADMIDQYNNDLYYNEDSHFGNTSASLFSSTSGGGLNIMKVGDGYRLDIARTGDVLTLNRISGSGSIAELYAVGAKVGDIGIDGDLYINSDTGEFTVKINGTKEYEFDANQFYSKVDVNNSLGAASTRWNKVYVANEYHNDDNTRYFRLTAGLDGKFEAEMPYRSGRNRFNFRHGRSPVPVAYDTFVMSADDVPCISIVETVGNLSQSTEQQLKLAVGDNNAVISTGSSVSGGLFFNVNRPNSNSGYLTGAGTRVLHMANDGAVTIGPLSSTIPITMNAPVKYEGWSAAGAQNRNTAIYIGRDSTSTSGEYFTMGWKPTARSGEVMQTGVYASSTAFYIEAGSTEAGGICLDQDSVTVYGSSDGGTTFRVVDKDSDLVTFQMNQTTWDGIFRSNVIAYGSMSSISDRRIKTDIVPIDPVMDKIKKLGVYSYNKITSPSDKKEIGVIAQELQEQFPLLVGEVDVDKPSDANGLEKILTVDYEHLTAILLKGLQEQQDQIDQLKQTIEEIKHAKDN